MKDLISIIVPVYNVEDYLPECIESIINQTYRNIEVILVDDGSRDKSGEICDYYAKEDIRIKVVHKKNTGVADSRNIGLEVAMGDYLFFVDSDDVLVLDAIEQMLKLSHEYNADMVCADCLCIDEDGNVGPYKGKNNKLTVMNVQESMKHYAQKEWSPWNKLIKKCIHKDIKFPNYKIHEDEAIKFKLLSRCNIVLDIDKKTYYYRQRKGSITASSNQIVDRMDMFYSRRENMKWLEKNHSDICVFFLNKVCEDALYNLGLLLKEKRNHRTIRRRNEIIDFSKKYYFKIMFNKYCRLSYKLRFTLINVSNWTKEKCLYVRFYELIGR